MKHAAPMVMTALDLGNNDKRVGLDDGLEGVRPALATRLGLK